MSLPRKLKQLKIYQDITKIQNSNFPKFQFSKIPIFQKKQKKQLCQDFASPPLPPMVCAELFFLFFLVFLFFLENWNFGKLEFWKIGILENWNFGNCIWGREGGLKQNRILSVAQKSIETQYKYI